MALVVFIRGMNVGGHRSFRPTILVERLKHLDIVNIGAAGTFVIRRPVTRSKLREELLRELPFEFAGTRSARPVLSSPAARSAGRARRVPMNSFNLVICQGREILDLISRDPFARKRGGSDVVRFVSVLSKRPRIAPVLPITFPPSGKWLVKVLEQDGRFVLGMYRRHMKVIGLLGDLDRMFGVPVTTRNWNTIVAIGRVLESRE